MQLKENIIVVEVPEDATGFSIDHTALWLALWFKQGENVNSRALPESGFILIGVHYQKNNVEILLNG